MDKNKLIKMILKILGITTIIFIIMTFILAYIVSINIGFKIETNNDWIGYYGVYLGSIITAIISVVGIYITLEYYREKDNEELNILKDELNILKEQLSLAVMPYFSINSIDKSQIEGKQINITNNLNERGFYNGKRLELKNVGNGSAIDCEFDLLNNSGINKKEIPFGCAKDGVINLTFSIAPNSFEIDDKLYIILMYKDLKSNHFTQKIWIKKERKDSNDYNMVVWIEAPNS